MLGREVALPLDLMFGKPPRSVSRPYYNAFVQWFSEVTEECFDAARHNLDAAASRQKRYFDIGVDSQVFGGRSRLVLLPAAEKVVRSADRPVSVLACLPNNVYKIICVDSGHTRSIHVDKLRPYLTESDDDDVDGESDADSQGWNEALSAEEDEDGAEADGQPLPVPRPRRTAAMPRRFEDFVIGGVSC